MTHRVQAFFEGFRGKRVALFGVGVSNTPVAQLLLRYGASVTAYDRKSRAQLGVAAQRLEAAGAELRTEEKDPAVPQADVILRSPGMRPDLPVFVSARKAKIAVTSEMELFMKNCPVHVYGVTGSDGKSTTTTVVVSLLEAAGKRVFLGGNLGAAMLPMLEEMTGGPNEAAVVELSSFQLADMTVSPQTAIVTNVAPNHLDWHTDMDEYIAAKRAIFAYQTPRGLTVCNADNAISAAFAGKAPGRVRLFSRKDAVRNGAFLRKDGALCYVRDGEERPVMPADSILLPGDHNVENYLAAIAAVGDLVPAGAIAEFAGRFGGVPHRCELIRVHRGVRWYNDSIGSSPTRTIANLRSFGKKVIWIAGGYDKHIPYDVMGPVVHERVKAAILIGATADAIETAIRRCGPLPIRRMEDMRGAVSAASEMAAEGDVVLMSPASASFDMYANFEERGEHFRQLVAAIP